MKQEENKIESITINGRDHYYTPIYNKVRCTNCNFINKIHTSYSNFQCRKLNCNKELVITNSNLEISRIKNKYDDVNSVFENFMINFIENIIEEECEDNCKELENIQINRNIFIFEENINNVRNLTFYKEISQNILNSAKINLFYEAFKSKNQNKRHNHTIRDFNYFIHKTIIFTLINSKNVLVNFLKINVIKGGYQELDLLDYHKNQDVNDVNEESEIVNEDMTMINFDIFDNIQINSTKIKMFKKFNPKEISEEDLDEFEDNINYKADIIIEEIANNESDGKLLKENLANNYAKENSESFKETFIPNFIKEKILLTLTENDSIYLKLKKEEQEQLLKSREKVKLFYEEIKESISEEDFIKLELWDERQYKNPLRIYHFKSEILKSITKHQISIIISETGSGKTTQIIQYAHTLKNLIKEFKIGGNNNIFPIICSQPRKISCVSIAKRISEETKLKINNEVKVILNSLIENEEAINSQMIFLSENSLLDSLIQDPFLKGIYILILDEAHERSINLDIILYLLKKYTLTRQDFRLIITSATINYKQFEDYFEIFSPEVINCEQDNNKISIIYSLDESITLFNFQTVTLEFVKNNVDELFSNNEKILPYLTILIFLPDLRSIQNLNENLSTYYEDYIEKEEMIILNLYGALTYEEQVEIIEYQLKSGIKIILSTNVAETSITITNCNVVIDTGLQKTRIYNSNTKMLEDEIEMISKDSARQRAGRCGRIHQGICFRLYTESQFRNMKMFRVPEIRKMNMSYFILKLIYFGMENIFDVKLIEQPEMEDIKNSLIDLENLQAITPFDQNDEFGLGYLITDFGKWLYDVQIEPLYGRIIYDVMYDIKRGLSETLTVISSLAALDNLLNLGKLGINQSANEFPSFINFEELHNKENNYSPVTEYIINLSSSIINKTILQDSDLDLENNKNEITYKNSDNLQDYFAAEFQLEKSKNYLNKIDNLSTFYEIFSILNPIFNKFDFFFENPICSLGDLIVNLYYIRQYKRILCQFHYVQIFNDNNFNFIPNAYDCKDCFSLKFFYMKYYVLNKKFLLLFADIEKNLKKILKSQLHLFERFNGLSVDCAFNEYQIAYWSSIYVYLHSNNFINFLPDAKYLLNELNKIDFNKIFTNIYSAYQELYTNVIGKSAFLVYSHNMAIKPKFDFSKREKEIAKKEMQSNHYLQMADFHLLVHSEEKCKFHKYSTFNQYLNYNNWKDINNIQKENSLKINIKSDLDFLIYSIQVLNGNEIIMKNINPVNIQMANRIAKTITEQIKNIYFKNDFFLFSIRNIGPSLFDFIIKRKKQLSENYYDNPLTKILETSKNFNKYQSSTIWFISNREQYKIDKVFVNNLINEERVNMREHQVDEFGYLNNDCLVLKIKNGLKIINVEYNKDQITFEILLNEQHLDTKKIVNLFKNKNLPFKKIYIYRKKIYVCFINSEQATEFKNNFGNHLDLIEIMKIKLVEENYSLQSNKQECKYIMSLTVSNVKREEKIINKIENFGKIKEILIRQGKDKKIVYFTMFNFEDSNYILNEFERHTDNEGAKWSSVERVKQDLTMEINNKSIQGDFWQEFDQFCEENAIEYTKFGKYKIVLEKYSEYKIRKILSFIQEDVIAIPFFAMREIKLNLQHTFFGKLGLEFVDFCKTHKVFIQIYTYLEK